MYDIDNAAEEYINKQEYESIDKDDKLFAAFKAGAEFTQRWINIEEELPEHYNDLLEDTSLRIKINGHTGFMKTKQVLVKFRNGNFDIGRRCKCCTDDYYFWDCLESFEENNQLNIISWRPIELK